MPLGSLGELRERAAARGGARVAVVGLESGTALEALAAAVRAGIARPVLVGDVRAARSRLAELAARPCVAESARSELRESLEVLEGAEEVQAASPEAAAAEAAALAGAGAVDVLLKGSLRTDELLRAVLDRRHGLRTGRLLSDVLLYEDVLSGRRRLVGVTDGGINVRPGPEELRAIVANAAAVFRALGFRRPRVALLSATEAVTDAVPSTVVARALAEEARGGGFGGMELDGPLALDNALLPSAAAAKGIGGPVAGRADVLVAPSLEAGNILGKAVKYYAGSVCAHVVVGARVPVLIPSRVESAEDKLCSIALGVLVRGAV